MPITFTLSGASDDLIETNLGGVEDEHDHYGNSPWTAELHAPDGARLRVWATHDGAWAVGASPAWRPLYDVPLGADETFPWPGWAVSIRQCAATSYSAELVVEVPDGTHLVLITEDGD